jgi:hypothetical protein
VAALAARFHQCIQSRLVEAIGLVTRAQIRKFAGKERSRKIRLSAKFRIGSAINTCFSAATIMR